MRTADCKKMAEKSEDFFDKLKPQLKETVCIEQLTGTAFFAVPVLIGAFMRENNPPVLLGGR